MSLYGNLKKFTVLLSICGSLAALGELQASWSAEVLMSTPGTTSLTSMMGVDSLGNVQAIWQEYNGTNLILQASSLPLGGSWTTPVTISDPTTNVQTPVFAVDTAGNAFALWISTGPGGQLAQAATLPFGGSWSSPATVSNSLSQAYEPQIIVIGSGSAVASWTEFDGSNWSVNSSTYTP